MQSIEVPGQNPDDTLKILFNVEREEVLLHLSVVLVCQWRLVIFVATCTYSNAERGPSVQVFV